MPRTTINVLFSGRDNGLVNLFQRIDQSVNTLDRNMNRLESTISRVDSRFRGLRSSSGFLSSIGGNNRGNGFSLQSVGLRGFQQALAGGSNILTSVLGRTASLTSSIFRGVTSTISGAVSSAYRNVTNMISFVDKAIMTFGNSIRQIAQGIQSFGIAFSIFVSAPLARILQGVVTEAVNFDDALVLVRKTTGATTDDIDKLGESLTNLSLGLPTSRNDLAKIAEDWGAIGIAISDEAGVNTMTELVRLTSMFVSSVRGVTAGDAVEKLGRFAAIYYPDVQSFVGEAEQLMSVLSALEDVTPLDTGEILAAAQRLAPVTKSLEIAPERALALAAAVASVNVSAERAGTQTSTALIDMVTNVDKVAQLFGTTEEKINSLMADSPDEFFYTLAASIGAVEDPLRRVQIVEEVFGKVGGKSIGSLVNSIPNLSAILQVANDEFARGTYLQWQFNASLDSTKSQLQILRNNLTYAGAAIGDALLPYITKFVTLAVPAIQMLTNWFKGLNDQVKIQVVGWMAFLAIAGPLVVFFSSLLFMIGLTISGFSSLFGVVGMMASGFISFFGALIGFLSPINLLVAALAGMAIYAVYLAKDLSAAGGVVQSYISKFYTWGYNLIASFASGIQSAASAAYNAVMSVINGFIGLIQSFSPPKQGPLRNIENWGKNLMSAYGDGIAKAGPSIVGAISYVNEGIRKALEGFSPETVSMFSNVFNSIKGVINTVGSHIGLETSVINSRIETAASSVASFIQSLEAGMPTGLGDIAGYLGGLSVDFEQLIILQSQYADGETRLRQIQKALKDINSETDKMIAKVITQKDLTADQQSAMIRRIKLEQSMREQSLQTEQDTLQAQQDQIKSDIDKKQQIIDILSSLIFPNGVGANGLNSDSLRPDKLDKPAIEPIDLVPFQAAAGTLDEVKKRFDSTGESVSDFTEKLGAARLMIEGFVAAVRGDDKASYSEMPDAFWKGWEQGENVRKNVLDFMEKFDAIYTKIKNSKKLIEDGFFAYLVGYQSGQNGGELNWEMIGYLSTLSAVMLVLGWMAGVAAKGVEDFMVSLFTGNQEGGEKSPVEIVIDRVLGAIRSFRTGWNNATKSLDLGGFVRSLGRIGAALGILGTNQTLWEALGSALGEIATATSKVVTGIDGIIQVIGIFSGVSNKKAFEDMYVSLGKGKKPAEELANEAGRIYDNLMNIRNGVADAIASVRDWYNFLTGQSPDKSDTGGAGTGGFSGPQTLEQQLDNSILDNVKDKFGFNIGQKVKDGINEGINSLSSWAETSAAISKLIENGALNAELDIKKNGSSVGSTFMLALQEFWENPLNYIAVMGAIPISAEGWRATTGKPLLDQNGQDFGADVLGGTKTKFTTDVSYFTTLITTMTGWITENVQSILDIGKSIGGSIIGGMTEGIKAGKQAFWDAIEWLVDQAWNYMPSWFRKFWEMTQAGEEAKEKEKKSNETGKGGGEQQVEVTEGKGKGRMGFNKGYTPFKETQTQAISGYNITINIDPSIASQIDRRSIDRLAEEIYSKMVRDMKLAGV